jgi:hypothetical protein
MSLHRLAGRLAVVLLAATTFWAALPAAPAKAVITFQPCSLFAEDQVTPSLACQAVGGAVQNTVATMNTDPGLFALTSWEYIVKEEFDASETLDTAFIQGDPSSGTFTLASSLWEAYNSISLVLKSGSTASNDGPCLIGYLITPDTLNGSYSSPFVCETSGELRDISNFAFYGSEEGGSSITEPIPLPAAAPMLLIALAGLALHRRRRHA